MTDPKNHLLINEIDKNDKVESKYKKALGLNC
jgi:hypothetical protein